MLFTDAAPAFIRTRIERMRPLPAFFAKLGWDALFTFVIALGLGQVFVHVVTATTPLTGSLLAAVGLIGLHLASFLLTLIYLVARKRLTGSYGNDLDDDPVVVAADERAELDRIVAFAKDHGSDLLNEDDYATLMRSVGQAREALNGADMGVITARNAQTTAYGHYRQLLNAYAAHSADIGAKEKFSVTV